MTVLQNVDIDEVIISTIYLKRKLFYELLEYFDI